MLRNLGLPAIPLYGKMTQVQDSVLSISISLSLSLLDEEARSFKQIQEQITFHPNSN